MNSNNENTTVKLTFLNYKGKFDKGKMFNRNTVRIIRLFRNLVFKPAGHSLS